MPWPEPATRRGFARHGARHVAKVLARRPPNTPGTPKLRQVIDGDAPVTLSALERRFLALLRAHPLPVPETNRPAGASASTAAGPSGASRSSLTATASTTRG